MKKIYLISNDQVWLSKKKYTSNNDLNNIVTCLKTNYDTNLVCRKSSKKLNFQLDDNLKYCQYNKIFEKEINVILVSISPYNFFVLFYLLLIRRVNLKGFVYLRSDGFLEYKYRYGFLGYFVYFIMFTLIKKKLKILSCSKNFTNVDVKNILHPSELNSSWFNKTNLDDKIKTDFLYVGRFKKDKGAFYLVKIFKDYLKDYKLKIVGNDKVSISKKYFAKNIDYLSSISDSEELIKTYDSAKIFILPSFIEGFPKVISESLARLKPVIIFQEIEYVIHGREGIFVCKREKKSLIDTINFILKNYTNIQKKIEQNYFYTKENFKKEFLASIKDEF
jgi:glycosyltransferase involved in cell wall biosynthesis